MKNEWCIDDDMRVGWFTVIFLLSPDKGFCVCLDVLHPDISRRPETISLCNSMLKRFRVNSLRSRNIKRPLPIPGERPTMSNTIAGSLRPTVTTSVIAITHMRAALAPLWSGGISAGNPSEDWYDQTRGCWMLPNELPMRSWSRPATANSRPSTSKLM